MLGQCKHHFVWIASSTTAHSNLCVPACPYQRPNALRSVLLASAIAARKSSPSPPDHHDVQNTNSYPGGTVPAQTPASIRITSAPFSYTVAVYHVNLFVGFWADRMRSRATIFVNCLMKRHVSCALTPASCISAEKHWSRNTVSPLSGSVETNHGSHTVSSPIVKIFVRHIDSTRCNRRSQSWYQPRQIYC